MRFWSIGIAFSKAKSIENGAKQSKFSPAAASDQDLRSEEGAKQGGEFSIRGGIFHPVCSDAPEYKKISPAAGLSYIISRWNYDFDESTHLLPEVLSMSPRLAIPESVVSPP